MKYGYEHKTGVQIDIDVYAEQFADDVKVNRMVSINGDLVLENEDPQELAKELDAMANRLFQIANFVRYIGINPCHRTE